MNAPQTQKVSVPSSWIRLIQWRPGRYIRSSGVLLVWLIIRALAQVALIIFLSRTLGANGYGRFVALLAVASFLTPFAGLGLQGILLRDGARDPENLPAHFYHATRVWLWTSLMCSTISVGAAWVILPHDLPWLSVPFVLAAEVTSASLTELIARKYQAGNKIGRYGALTAGLPLMRLAMLAPYLYFMRPTLGGWLWAYAAGSLAYVALLIILHWPKSIKGPALRLRDGLPFSIGALSLRLQSEFNKPVLAHQSFDLVGNFSAAQRVVDVATLPLLAMQEALWPRVYAAQKADSTTVRIVSIFLLVASFLAGVTLWIFAPHLADVLGDEFSDSISALQWMAGIPLLQVIRNLTNARSALAQQTQAIGWAYAAGALGAVLTTLLFVPTNGMAGAVLALYVVEILTIATQWILVKSRKFG